MASAPLPDSCVQPEAQTLTLTQVQNSERRIVFQTSTQLLHPLVQQPILP
jgi:hypothetical protein